MKPVDVGTHDLANYMLKYASGKHAVALVWLPAVGLCHVSFYSDGTEVVPNSKPREIWCLHCPRGRHIYIERDYFFMFYVAFFKYCFVLYNYQFNKTSTLKSILWISGLISKFFTSTNAD